jgi:acyl carrier protein phosphodiesterase
MNYLFHLFLSDPDPEVMLGNLMGDFVKGRLELADYPESILFGLKQHRQVDSFANRSSAFQASRQRIDPKFGYFRSIMIDVFYDHLLARAWERHHPIPLEQFAQQVYRTLEMKFDSLPAKLQKIVPRMIKHNWFVSYQNIEIIETVLIRLDQRIKRPTPLAAGLSQLKLHYSKLEDDCDLFLSQAQAFLSDKRRCQSSANNRE